MIIKERGRRMSIIIASLLAAGVLAFILTPLVRSLAFKLGAVDKPNARRVNKVTMPTMGGLAIFIAFNLVNFFYSAPAISTTTTVDIICG